MNPILLDIPMPILTPRLRIQPRHVGEGKIIAQAIRESLEHLKPWMPFAKESPTDEKTEEHARRAYAQYILRENFTLSIYDREGKTFIGSTGIHDLNWAVPSFSLGYWVHKKFEGKGYIAESTNALTRYAFEVLKAKRVEIRCDGRNHRSLAVMQKLGYVQEGTLLRDSVSVDGSVRDTIVTARYSLENLPALAVTWK